VVWQTWCKGITTPNNNDNNSSIMDLEQHAPNPLLA